MWCHYAQIIKSRHVRFVYEQNSWFCCHDATRCVWRSACGFVHYRVLHLCSISYRNGVVVLFLCLHLRLRIIDTWSSASWDWLHAVLFCAGAKARIVVGRHHSLSDDQLLSCQCLPSRGRLFLFGPAPRRQWPRSRRAQYLEQRGQHRQRGPRSGDRAYSATSTLCSLHTRSRPDAPPWSTVNWGLEGDRHTDVTIRAPIC